MRKTIVILSAILGLLLHAMSAHAVGFGAYGSAGGGSTYYGKLTLGDTTALGANLIWTPQISAGGGLVIDTNCAGDELFNYRFMAGVDALLSKRPTVEKMYRLDLTSTFGFGVVRTQLVRLWMGPQLGFYYLSGTNRYPMQSMFLWKFDKIEQSMFGVGFGLSIGINFNPGEYVTVSLEGGARYIIYYGIQSLDMIIMNVNDFGSGGYIPYTYNSWTPSSGYEGYGCISVLYRVKDTFVRKPDRHNGK